MRISDWSSDVCSSDLILPFTREQESEADHIGLMLMAKAGYDPRGAVELWRNFEAAGGERPPEFLSTHPAPGSRIANPIGSASCRERVCQYVLIQVVSVTVHKKHSTN